VLLAAARVAAQRLHEERGGAHAGGGVVGAPVRNAADEHIAVADRFDLEQAELVGDDVKGAEELAEHVDELGGADARGEGVKPTRSTNMTEAASWCVAMGSLGPDLSLSTMWRGSVASRRKVASSC
jgi:hypothetical protein